MRLNCFELTSSELQSVLSVGGVGRYMAERPRTTLAYSFWINDKNTTSNPTSVSFAINGAAPGRLIVGKDRDTVRRGLGTRQDVISIQGLGTAVALVGSYSAPMTTSNVVDGLLSPLRHPRAAIATIKKGIMPRVSAGQDMYAAEMTRRGFFVLITGRTKVQQVPGGMRMVSLGDYQLPMRNVLQALPPE